MENAVPRARLSLAGALVAVLLAALAIPAAAQASGIAPGKGAPGDAITVFGHRGAAGYRPEHTSAAYMLGARMGADYIEPDLVSTKDGVLVVRHEPEIGATTNVADHPEFADRKTTKVIDGISYTGWFTDDFTLAELKTLRAKERLPDVRQRNTIYDGRYEIPTFQEVIDLSRKLSKELHRTVGIVPETKHPSYFKAEGLDTTKMLIAALRRNHLDGPHAKVIIQSFETKNLRELDKAVDVPLLALLDSPTIVPGDVQAAGGTSTYADLATPAGLRGIARYADWVGPSTTYIIPTDPAGEWLAPTSFVGDAHAAGLKVVPYTFRNENQFLPPSLRLGTDPNAYGNVFAQYDRFFDLGVDGVFSDNPDTAVAARDEWLAAKSS
jgi:glycerophosphoryl diester phosphodiesterase